MTLYVCNQCGMSVDKKTGVRAFRYGTVGVTLSPIEKAVKQADSDLHFCGGYCAIHYFAWLKPAIPATTVATTAESEMPKEGGPRGDQD